MNDTIKYHTDVMQGGDEWHQLRCGILTASEMKLILTPTLKTANNDKQIAHVWEITSQRITQYVEPQFYSDDMIRGHEDEVKARDLYSEHIAPVTKCGFVTNNSLGFTIGYSPDGLVGEHGLIEIKSRRQKYQIQTIIEGVVPAEYMLQLQTGLLVSGRQWVDFISYSAGLDLFVMRVHPDLVMQQAIILAATDFNLSVSNKVAKYHEIVSQKNMIKTQRNDEGSMFI